MKSTLQPSYDSIAVLSGKGGVGKSTVSALLALALCEEKKTLLFDADIQGPSAALLMGEPHETKWGEKGLLPAKSEGLSVLSIDLLKDKEEALIWRGPMASSAMKELLQKSELDEDTAFLVADLPPGTGDIPLSLAQSLPLCGAIVVTTPAEIARLDAKKAVNMLARLHVPILGFLENMSYFQCECGKVHHPFGQNDTPLYDDEGREIPCLLRLSMVESEAVSSLKNLKQSPLYGAMRKMMPLLHSRIHAAKKERARIIQSSAFQKK